MSGQLNLELFATCQQNEFCLRKIAALPLRAAGTLWVRTHSLRIDKSWCTYAGLGLANASPGIGPGLLHHTRDYAGRTLSRRPRWASPTGR